MLSVQQTQELLASLNLTDEVAEDVRAVTTMLVELAFDAWMDERKKIKQHE